MNNAQGSLEELRYYTILARDLGYLPSEERSPELIETGKLLGAHVRTLRSSAPSRSS
jgi:four helix bundle protein